VAEIVKRLSRQGPEKALPWLDRFTGGAGSPVGWVRGDVAVRLLEKDRDTALRVAGAIRNGPPRAITYARLAGIVFHADPKRAHAGLEEAGEALTAAEEEVLFESGQRTGAAVYLLCLAERMAYPDMASLTAVAMTTREPVPIGPHVEQTRRRELL